MDGAALVAVAHAARGAPGRGQMTEADMKNGTIRTPAPMKAVLRLGNEVLEAPFEELVRCDFPLSGWEPIPVEIPLEGSLSHFGRSRNPGTVAGAGPTFLHVPRYGADGRAVNQDALRPLHAGSDKARLMAATPILAIATRTDHPFEDGMRSRASSVLLVWASGTAVVVSVDWSEGSLDDGVVGPEWHVRATQGLSVARGFEALERETRVVPGPWPHEHRLYVAPGALGVRLLGDSEGSCRLGLWTHEWRCDGFEDVQARLATLAGQVAGLTAEIQ